MSFCSGGVPGQVPPGRYTAPSGPGTPPSGQGTPRQVHPPWSRYTPLGPGTPTHNPPTPSRHTPGPGTPPWDQVHPRDQVHPQNQVQPPRTRYTPHPVHSMLEDTVNTRAVRILLDCILVYSFFFLVNCPEKLHENEKKWIKGGGGRASLEAPLGSSNANEH